MRGFHAQHIKGVNMKRAIFGILFLGSLASISAQAGSYCQGRMNDVELSGSQRNVVVAFKRTSRYQGKKLMLQLDSFFAGTYYYTDTNNGITMKAKAYLEPALYNTGKGRLSVQVKNPGGKNGRWDRYIYNCR
jgi:hypothetical protein